MMEKRAAEAASLGGPKKRRRKERLEIPIRTDRRFKPGTAPPQPRISLLPARGGDAFIVDKVIYPLEPSTDPTVQRKLCYIVGWTNLPAARVIISCAKALDYLSPYAVEEWEYKDCLRREEEEFAAATEEAILISLGGEVPVEDKGEATVKQKKKPGRPPKKARLAEEQPPTPVLAEEEQELMRAKRASGPSLSTPQKRRLEQLILEEQVYEDNDEADILQQLYNDTQQDPMDLDTDAPFPSTDNVTEEDELGQRLPSTVRQPFKEKGKAPISSLTTSSANTTPVATKQPPAARLPYGPSSSLPKLNGTISATSSSYGSAAPSPASHPESATPLALKLAKAKGKPGRKPKVKPSPPAEVPDMSSNGATHTPTLEPPRRSWGFTPIKAPTSSTPKQSYSISSSSNLQQQQSEDTPTSRKPLNEGKKKTPKATLPDPQHQDLPAAGAEDVIQAEPEPEQLEEVAWEVLRLEGERLVDMPDGTQVQYFKVRWKGDWPADQNPSWEPEENISKGIVRSYLKKKAKRDAARGTTSTPKKKSQKTLSSWVLGPKYSSVMDAVEGKEEAEEAEKSFSQPGRDDEDELMGGDMDEVLRVTGAPSSAKAGTNGRA